MALVTSSLTYPPDAEDLLDLEPERGLVLDVRAEDVAGGDGGDAEVLGDARCLGALTGTGRAEDDQAHAGAPSRWVKGARAGRSISGGTLHSDAAAAGPRSASPVSRPTPTMIRIEVPPKGKLWSAPTRTSATSGMSETNAR
jgi:hypothetical protein